MQFYVMLATCVGAAKIAFSWGLFLRWCVQMVWESLGQWDKLKIHTKCNSNNILHVPKLGPRYGFVCRLYAFCNTK